MKMTSKEIRSTFLFSERFMHVGDNIFVADADYFIPSRQWIEEGFHYWFAQALEALRVDKYHRSNDCDNFAMGYQWLANVCHSQSQSETTQAVSIGQVFYCIDGDPDKKHAINVAFVDEGELVYIEPQGPEVIELSEAEERSIFFVRF